MSEHKLCSLFVEENSMNKPTNSSNSFTFEFLQLFSNLSREQTESHLISKSFSTMSFKGVAWAGNVYEKFEAMCLEVEEAMYQVWSSSPDLVLQPTCLSCM